MHLFHLVLHIHVFLFHLVLQTNDWSWPCPNGRIIQLKMLDIWPQPEGTGFLALAKTPATMLEELGEHQEQHSARDSGPSRLKFGWTVVVISHAQAFHLLISSRLVDVLVCPPHGCRPALPRFTCCFAVGLRWPTFLPIKHYSVSWLWSRFPCLIIITLGLAAAPFSGQVLPPPVFAAVFRLVGLNQASLGVELSGLAVKAWTDFVPSVNVGQLVEPLQIGSVTINMGSMDTGARNISPAILQHLGSG